MNILELIFLFYFLLSASCDSNCISYHTLSDGTFCCYKLDSNTYLTSYYRDCNILSTSCDSYSYSNYYTTKCCIFRGQSPYFPYPTEIKYCPSTNTLKSICPVSTCCNAHVAVDTGYSTFHYTQYFCNTTSFSCGVVCTLFIVVGFLLLICCVFSLCMCYTCSAGKNNPTTARDTQQSRLEPAHQPSPSIGIHSSVAHCPQQVGQVGTSLIPGYTYTKTSNTNNTVSYLDPMDQPPPSYDTITRDVI